MKKFITIIILFILIFGLYYFKTSLSTKQDNNPETEETRDEFELYLDKAIEIMRNEKTNKADINKYLDVFNTKNMAWCTEFIIWSLLDADKELNTNYVTTLYPLLDTGQKAANWFSKYNRLHLEDEYIPKRGDFMFFKYYDYIIDHTAFVIDVKEIDGIIYVYTIEGNIPSLEDKSIQERIIPLNDKYIYGYGSFE